MQWQEQMYELCHQSCSSPLITRLLLRWLLCRATRRILLSKGNLPADMYIAE